MFFSTSDFTRRRKYGRRSWWSSVTWLTSVSVPKRLMKSISELNLEGSMKFRSDHNSFMLFYRSVRP